MYTHRDIHTQIYIHTHRCVPYTCMCQKDKGETLTKYYQVVNLTEEYTGLIGLFFLFFFVGLTFLK